MQTIDTRRTIRSCAKLSCRSALLSVAKFRLSKATSKDKTLMFKHHLRCKAEALNLLKDRNFVKPYGYESVGYYFLNLICI